MLRVTKSSSLTLTVGFSVLTALCRISVLKILYIKKKFV